MSVSTVIVGLGKIGMGYDLDLDLDPTAHVYSHARAFSQHPDFSLTGGVDPDARLRQNFTRAYDSPAYADLETALEQQRPALVIVAAPTRLHGQIVQQVLNYASPRAVLCEKPLSYDLQDARNMVQASATKGVSLYVNYMRRSDAGAIEIKRRLDSGEIRAPAKGMVWYSKGLVHNGSHFFNLLEYWLGPMRSWVVLNRGRLWNGTDPEPDVQVAFERGTMTFLAAWEEAFSHCSIELLSLNGRLRYDRGGRTIQWEVALPDPDLRGYTVLSSAPETIASGMNRYQLHVVEQLANALNGRSADLCTGADALRTLESINQILEGM
jgi:predicted dehydrogenase